jgi:hypothetical protein
MTIAKPVMATTFLFDGIKKHLRRAAFALWRASRVVRGYNRWKCPKKPDAQCS